MLKANSFLCSPILFSNTLNDLIRKSSVSETPFLASTLKGHNRWPIEVTRGNHYCGRGDQWLSLLCERLPEVITTAGGVTSGYLYCLKGDQR